MSSIIYTPGMRVLCRDAEWLINKVDLIKYDPDKPEIGSIHALYCVGVDDLVRGHNTVFLTNLDKPEPVDPAKTKLIGDTSSGYKLSRLFLEAQLRQMPYTDVEPDIENMGVFKAMEFQVNSVRHALNQLRPRLLLADAVGLGKTIQVGMILTELMRRGRANRILVLAKKSMLAQFQSELWNRFNIPLVRLDSQGIARLRLRIPSNKNPFEVYHRVIISMDTLKNVSRYEHFLEDTHWDVVIIDEAHNVAGASMPERNKSFRLARMLSRRSDSMLLTTATPHNGKPETFGRLISLLDPSAIPDPDLKEYDAEDIKNFFLLRYKEDIRYEAGELLSDREVVSLNETTIDASPEEENVYELLDSMRNGLQKESESKNFRNHRLVQYGIYKLFLSSPEACLSTISTRLKEIAKKGEGVEVNYLKKLQDSLSEIELENSSRFSLLIDQLKTIGWDGSDRSPRILIFTEYRKTQDALVRAIAKAFAVEYDENYENQSKQIISMIHGSTPDIHLMSTVEAFGTGNAPVRMLIATDVASEGINLHHECHNIIHYDLPWSIITLIQRNGRIDRLGQKEKPVVRYLRVNTEQGLLKGDSEIFERLVQKVEEINRTRESGESILKLYDAEKEEEYIADNGILANNTKVFEDTDTQLSTESSALELILNNARLGDFDMDSILNNSNDPNSIIQGIPHLYNDKDFFLNGFSFLKKIYNDYEPIEEHDDIMLLTPPEDLRRRLGAPGKKGEVIFGSTAIPEEAWSSDGRFRLSDNPDQVELAIKAARNTSGYWTQELYCNNQNPIIQWLIEKLLMQLKRGEAPYAQSDKLAPKELCFCFIGKVNSQSGTPLIVNAHGITFRSNGEKIEKSSLEDILTKTDFLNITNTGKKPNLKGAEILLPSAVQQSIAYMKDLNISRSKALAKLLRNEERRLKKWEKSRKGILNRNIKEHGEKHPGSHKHKKDLQWIDLFLSDREKWRDAHFKSANEPVTQLILVIGGPEK